MKKITLIPLFLWCISTTVAVSSCCKDPMAEKNTVPYFQEFLPGTTWQLHSKYKVYRTEVNNPLEETVFQDCSIGDKIVFESDTTLSVINPFCTTSWGNASGALGGLCSNVKFELGHNEAIHNSAIWWDAPKELHGVSFLLSILNDTTLVFWEAGTQASWVSPEINGTASKFYLKN